MKLRQFTPEKLEIAAFIEAQGEIEGECPVGHLPRLAASLAPDVDLSALSIMWSAKGWLAPQKGGAAHRWLTLNAQAHLPWTCQRCLQPVSLPIEVSRRIRWVDDEAQAEALDAELEDDVLALLHHINVLALIEDECIMEAPLVPRHETCPIPVKLSTTDLDDAEAAVEVAPRPNPFAVLAALKSSKKDGAVE